MGGGVKGPGAEFDGGGGSSLQPPGYASTWVMGSAVAAPELFCGGIEGGGECMEGVKNPKLSRKWHFFPSEAGKVGEEPWGKMPLMLPPPWCRHWGSGMIMVDQHLGVKGQTVGLLS